MAMMNLKDKKQRQQLIARYLDADTSVEEERALADFYRHCDERELTDEDLDIRNMMLGLGIVAQKQETARIQKDEPARIQKNEKAGSQSKWVRFSAIMLAAAMLAGLIFLVFPIKDRMSQKPNFAALAPTTQVIRSQQTADDEEDLSPAEQMERQDSIFLATTKDIVTPQEAKRGQKHPSISSESKSRIYARTISYKSLNINEEKDFATAKEESKYPESSKLFDTKEEKTESNQFLALQEGKTSCHSEAKSKVVGDDFQKLYEVASVALPSADQLKIDRQDNHIVISTTDDNGNTQRYTVDVDDAQDGIYQFYPLAQLNNMDE